MPWQKTTPMTARRNFSELYHTRLWAMTELGTRCGISRTTGDQWLGRYLQEGRSGLREQLRMPRPCPHRLAPGSAAVLWEAKRLHPQGGPRKILPYVARHHPALGVPAASRAGAGRTMRELRRSTPVLQTRAGRPL